ncbi:unnamed protein product [Trichogramma brassicae]|uniref:Uncharacterized protein n=1 Tax=Trichogramma brassicae TaxID=86971 RepID=A0A6H5I0L9_9HYME|nr:unnamed protein product [Trichogramma brassicae]
MLMKRINPFSVIEERKYSATLKIYKEDKKHARRDPSPIKTASRIGRDTWPQSPNRNRAKGASILKDATDYREITDAITSERIPNNTRNVPK